MELIGWANATDGVDEFGVSELLHYLNLVETGCKFALLSDFPEDGRKALVFYRASPPVDGKDLREALQSRMR